ncbi:MAG: STAS domain-containing protein [Actinomycetota bacterium]|nr:STAS domain-containing protein [Actinomycetota bacterium]
MEDTDRTRRPTIRLELYAPDVAIATLTGEHDLASKAELTDVLARASAQRYVLVDLSECAFMDSTVLSLLVLTCQSQWERDGRLELVIPRETSAIQRVMTIAGLTTFLTIHETRDEGLASLQADG